MWMPRACAVVFVAGLLAKPVLAGPADDCNQVRNLDQQLRGCSAYIRLGQGEPQNLATAYLNRANIYAQRAKYERAFADFDSAMALDRTNPLIPYNRGNAYFDTQQYERAIADYSRAIELDQRFAFAYFNRGVAYERMGDTAAAVRDYRQTLAIDPSASNAEDRLQSLQSQ
jgi:tetratricopeptide (TPR) repeat protein